MKKTISFLLAALLLLGSIPALAAEAEEFSLREDGLESRETGQDNARVFYEIFVGSFSDSDGDGVGDLRGIIERMDYLNDGDPDSGKSLGVEGIWLTPIFLSPTYHKYDVTNYYQIDPDFGTLSDLRELIGLCHERDVKIILDLPINHTGDGNSWFAAFRAARKAGDTNVSSFNYYSAYNARTGSPEPGKNYERIPGTEDYYECNFSPRMPELNYDNNAVRALLLDVALYYLDMGIDGFRFDAAKYIYFGDDVRSAEFWDWYIGQLRAIKPDVYTVAEVWDGPSVIARYYSSTNCFDFTASQSGGMIASAVLQGRINQYTSYVESYLELVGDIREGAMFVPFITNHDMDRAAGFLKAGTGDMAMAANIYLLSPGSPFIYYGEELGMKGSRGGANTDANRRLAMLWGDGDTVQDPPGSTYKAQAETSAAEQVGDPDSLYTTYKRLLMIRKAHPEIARGDYTALKLSGKAGGFVSEWDGSRVCVIHNVSTDSQTIHLASAGIGEYTVVSACVGAGNAEVKNGLLILSGQTSVVLRPAGDAK